MKIGNCVILVPVLVVLLTMSACTTKRSLVGPSVSITEPAKKLDEISSGNLEFDWYYAKGSATISYENTSLTANADIRVKKDSAILVVIRMLGLELGRAFITEDSFFLVNRMEGNYMAESIGSISKLYKIPFTFYELQQILAGNQLTEGMSAQQLLAIDGKTILETTGERMNASFILDGKKISSAIYRLHTGESAEAEFENFNHLVKKKLSPFNRKYYYPSKDKFEYAIELQLEDIELDKEKTMKFEIPAKYIRI